MKKRAHVLLKTTCLVSTLFFLLLTQGCVKLIADYDAEISREIVKVSKQVDLFYGDLLETEYAERSYDAFKKRYIEIEVNIRALVVQNKARPLNSDSVAIAETILEKWIKYKEKHKQNWAIYQAANGYKSSVKVEDIYKDVLAKNHRQRFTRLFIAMSVAEEAKKIAADDAGDEQ